MFKMDFLRTQRRPKLKKLSSLCRKKNPFYVVKNPRRPLFSEILGMFN